MKAFKAKFGEDKIPTHINAHAYDQFLLVADAVRRGGTTRRRSATGSPKIKSFEATTGKISFDAKGQSIDLA